MHSLKFHQNFYFWQLKQRQLGNQDISTNKKTKKEKTKNNYAKICRFNVTLPINLISQILSINLSKDALHNILATRFFLAPLRKEYIDQYQPRRSFPIYFK